MNAHLRIDVAGPEPCPVYVGHGLLDVLPGMLPDAAAVAVIHSRPVVSWAHRTATVLRAAGMSVSMVEVPDAEAGKTVEVAARCWDTLGAAGFTRSDAVVGVGGGAVTDLAGVVAAGWLRGVRVVQVATSLLGMVDAAVGGKTGVNIGAGKNLVGAFHPPVGVLCDLDALSTLDTDELRGGLAEVIKCGFIADTAILDLVEADPAAALYPTGPVIPELVERAVRVKAEVVGVDLRESGPREILNYGHTLGHAIERHERYRWRHGYAVSVGLVYAARLAVLAGRLDRGTEARHARLLAAVGLPVTYRADAWPALRDAMRVDKKTRGGRLRFVVLDGPELPAILADPPEDLLREAYEAVAVDPEAAPVAGLARVEGDGS